MKKSYNFWIYTSLIMVFASCSEELEITKLEDTENVNSVALLAPVAGAEFETNIDSPDDVAMVVEWNEPKYSENLIIRYFVEIVNSNSNFENTEDVKELGTSVTDSFYISHSNFNKVLLSLGLKADEKASVKIRVRSSVNYQIKETISEVVELAATPYFDPSSLPEELFMTGASLNAVGDGGWDWNTNYTQFNPVHSHPELFWAVDWLDPTVQDAGFKISSVRDWGPAFGVEGDAVDGVWKRGGNNIDVPTAGYYTVVVDYISETIEVNEAKIYGIGNVFGSWDAANHLFTVDKENKVIKYSGNLSEGELRMHVAASTLKCDWWQAEFIILNDKIEYRGTGDDQERVNIPAGEGTITVDFINGTGSIE